MTDANIERITQDIAAPLLEETGALLPILHALQDYFCYIPAQAVPVVARLLGLSRAEVHGVISFYDGFKSEPGGKSTVYICRAEACRAMGCAAVEETAKAHLGISYHETTGDGLVRLEPVYCLGNCACSPSVMVDNRLYSRVTQQDMEGILDKLRARES